MSPQPERRPARPRFSPRLGSLLSQIRKLRGSVMYCRGLNNLGFRGLGFRVFRSIVVLASAHNCGIGSLDSAQKIWVII